ncbi:MAG: MarR family winged helix-turn-helix transcriptional regulator [Solirubrobacteraceae bacterium]
MPNLQTESAQRLRQVIGSLARLLRPTDAGLAADLTPTRIAVLLRVDRHGRLRLSDVAAEEGLNPTLLSRAITKLVVAGLLVRTSDLADRRSAWLEVTAAGSELADEIRRERTQALRAALNKLDQADLVAVNAAIPALESLAVVLRDARP